jgi:hypothetical protein
LNFARGRRSALIAAGLAVTPYGIDKMRFLRIFLKTQIAIPWILLLLLCSGGGGHGAGWVFLLPLFAIGGGIWSFVFFLLLKSVRKTDKLLE